ncbi:hypothetical protein D1113_03015 [Mycoplasmopsis gallopavonis]|nr:hypothetical protein D1113_03015 [Mycoplasmopsis gallopavonis]
MEIKTNNRLHPKEGEGIRFGVVVTLREMKGINRIQEFIEICKEKNLSPKVIDVDNREKIYQKFNEDIELK